MQHCAVGAVEIGVADGLIRIRGPHLADGLVTEDGVTVTRQGFRVPASSGPGQGNVPDVAGQDPGTATNTLIEAGLTATRGEDEASDSVPQGTVIRTDPAAGTPVDSGANVSVIVSSGVGQVGVPDVKGLDESAAKSQLEAAGFAVQVTDNRTLNPGEDGKVVSQTPGGGSQADKGSTVSIVVNRFREELRSGRTENDAIVRAFRRHPDAPSEFRWRVVIRALIEGRPSVAHEAAAAARSTSSAWSSSSLPAMLPSGACSHGAAPQSRRRTTRAATQ